MPSRPEYSLVVPIYNEEETIPELVRRLAELVDKLDGEAEVILVDDGSGDRSYELMSAARDADPRFKLLRLSRNFGHQIAVTAGLDVAAGNAVIVMDADLRTRPKWRSSSRPAGAKATRSSMPCERGVRAKRRSSARLHRSSGCFAA